MIQDLSFAQIKVGDSAQMGKTITEFDVYGYAGISMDFNPIHINKEFAAGSRFKQRIAHGMLSASLISAVIGTALPGRNAIYLEQYVKFTAPVFIGDTLKAVVTVTEKLEGKGILKLKTQVFNQEEKLVVDGEATVMKK
jgi:3-hydroxybutyryl-CoA dehydratase